MADLLSDIVVFYNPDNTPFSMDPRWNDSRVREAWIKKYSQTEEPETVDEVEDEDEEEDEDYSTWTNDELRAELNKRQLSLDGKKADLLARLEESDREYEE